MSTRVAVVGAGPGGYAAAFYAADLGMQVTLIDPEKNPGGVCLYRGCIPSKALLHVAKVLDEAGHATRVGHRFRQAQDRCRQAAAYKNKVVDKLTSGTGQVAKLRKVNYLQGWATIVTPTRLQVRTDRRRDQTVDVDHIILATGSEPTRIPALSIDSPRDSRFDRRARPARSPQDDAGHRRRVHRAGARLGVRRLGHARCRSSK